MTEPGTDAVLVEQAKGVIMLRYGVSSYESLAALAQWAREAHVPIGELAHALVKGVCQGRVTPDTRGLVRWLEQRLRADIGDDATAPPAPAPEPTTVGASGFGGKARRAAGAAGGGGGGLGGGGRAARLWRYSSAVHAARALGNP